MENNTILGSCLSIVYHLNDDEISKGGFTSDNIVLYIKTKRPVSEFKSIADVKKRDIFARSELIALRVASECQFGLFGDSHCDCESQRRASLNYIAIHQGIYIHMPQEAQGRGLYYKARELQLQVRGLDQNGKFVGKKDIVEASKMLLGTDKVDRRNFHILYTIFNDLNLKRYKYVVISSNPKKITDIGEYTGVDIIDNIDVNRYIDIDNIGEYLSKMLTKKFNLSHDELRKIYEVILSADNVPERAMSVLRHIEELIMGGYSFGENNRLLQNIIDAAKSKSKLGDISLFGSDVKSRTEYQVELSVSDDQIGSIFSSNIIVGVSGLAFEENFFYTLNYFNGVRSQDLKIRRRCKVNPNSRDRIIDNTIVYKTLVGNGKYKIRDMLVDDNDLANLILHSFKSYEVNYVPVFTHTCELNPIYNKVVLVLLKRYSQSLRTISLMGPEKDVKMIVSKLKNYTGPMIEVPDPTNFTTVDEDIIVGFNYNILANDELSIFKKYYIG